MCQKSKYEADLHCHTSASDGLLTPEGIIEHAVRRGLRAIAITDHDTINGWTKAEETSERLGILLIKGIEINTDWEGKEVHILGFGMDENNKSFKKQLFDLQEKRIFRIKEILEKLKKLGIDISFTDVLQYARGESVGRPHVAQAMVKKGYIASIKMAFDRYLKIGCPAYVPRYKLSPTQAIKIINDSGGIPVLAHPGVQDLESDIRQWVEEGLLGIEITHPDHSLDDKIKYHKIAERKGLIATGGSDYHGPGIKPGIELGDWGVGLDIVDQLEQMIKQNQIEAK